jgi:hypothetical protein
MVLFGRMRIHHEIHNQRHETRGRRRGRPCPDVHGDRFCAAAGPHPRQIEKADGAMLALSEV